jgi:transcriptional regulator with XRE-family HTH domain
MKPSPLRHNLARLRVETLHIGQKEMAEECRCSVHTIQAIELERLALSESLARRISAATGVGLRWLLDNDLSAPIVNRAGYPYLRLTFESRRAGKAFGDNRLSRQSLADFAVFAYAQIRGVLSSASKRNFAEVATWRLGKFLDSCRREFGHDEGLIEVDESPYPNAGQVEAAIELFRRYDRERTARRPTIRKFSKEDNARFVAHMQSMLDKKPAAKKRTIKRSRSTPHRKRQR